MQHVAPTVPGVDVGQERVQPPRLQHAALEQRLDLGPGDRGDVVHARRGQVLHLPQRLQARRLQLREIGQSALMDLAAAAVALAQKVPGVALAAGVGVG